MAIKIQKFATRSTYLVRIPYVSIPNFLMNGEKNCNRESSVKFRMLNFVLCNFCFGFCYLLTGDVCGQNSDHNSKKRICNVRTRSLWYVEIVVCRLYHTSSFRETSFRSAKVAGTEFWPIEAPERLTRWVHNMNFTRIASSVQLLSTC